MNGRRHVRVYSDKRQDNSLWLSPGNFYPTSIDQFFGLQANQLTDLQSERRGIEAGGRAGAGGGRFVATDVSGDTAGRQLPPGEAPGAALSAGGRPRAWIEQYGVPHALYADWKNVHVRAATEAERAADVVPLRQFGRMCAALGIRIIPASSPQAKGRMERNHGTHQDRLVKKLRRLGIRDVAAANQFLEATYWTEHNQRFARGARASEDFHRRRATTHQLDQIFYLEETRVVGQDRVVRYHNRVLQLARQSQQTPARGTVTVCE